MLTLTEASEQIRTRRISPLELTRECLSRIERLNPLLNAFITVTGDLALEEARQAEAEVTAGNWRGPLHGIPIGLKDLLDVSGVRTTAASNQFCNRIATDDAKLVKLLKHSGAVILGKLNLHEFAFGMSGIVSAFGPARNPWDTGRITGGSSSGSAAAVAAGLCVASIGSDTAGSIRCPAALCGIVGHRPSAGLLSADGMIPLAPTFDTAGPMTQNVRDAAVLLGILSGAPMPKMDEPDASVSTLRIGVPRRGFFDDLQAEVQSCLEEALAVVRKLVAEVRDVPLAVASRRTVFNAEIYEYHEKMATETPQLYQPATLSRVEKCAGISATDYIRARRELHQQRRAAEAVFERVDLLITPTTPVIAPEISQLMPLGERLRDFETKYLLRNTTPFSYLYWPSTSVPCGFTAEGLPVGMQISGRPGQDAAVLRLAYAYEQATEWHKNNKEGM